MKGTSTSVLNLILIATLWLALEQNEQIHILPTNPTAGVLHRLLDKDNLQNK
jgi:hypothetical protein